MKKFINKIDRPKVDWLTVGILGGLVFMGLLPILVYFGYLN